MVIKTSRSSSQIQTKLQPKIVKFTAMKIGNLAILSMIIVMDSFLTALWSTPERYYVFFGAFVLSPIIVLGLAKLHYTKKNTNLINLSAVPVIALLGIFFYLNVSPNMSTLTLILFGFFINSFLLTAWTVMPYSTRIKSMINDDHINLTVNHYRLFIGTSTSQISIPLGVEVTIQSSDAKLTPFSKSFVFHHLHFWEDGHLNRIPFLSFPERGIQLAAKLQQLFNGSNCVLKIDRSILNSKNLFMRLIFPKVSTGRLGYTRNSRTILAPNKLMIDNFSTFGDVDNTMLAVNPIDISIISVNSFLPILNDHSFKKSRLVSKKRLFAALLLGIVYLMFGLLIVYVSSAISYVVFLRGWYGPFIIQLYLTIILTGFVLRFFYQGIVYPIFLLIGRPMLEYKMSELTEKKAEKEILVLKYHLGFITGMKIKLPSILEPKVIKSDREYTLVVSLDNQHQLQLPMGAL